MRDLVSNISAIAAIIPQVATATVTSATMDLSGFDSAAVLISTGAIVGAGNMTPKLQECATSGGTYTDVVAADLIGSFPSVLVASTHYKVGYKGNKQFLKAVGTLNSGTSVALSMTLVRGNAKSAPVA